MFLNVDQLEKQLDNKEFQEIGSMASFKGRVMKDKTRQQREKTILRDNIHTEQPEFNMRKVDQNAEQCHDIRPLPAKLTDDMTTELSNQLLESENVCLKKTVAQCQKDFAKLEALLGNSRTTANEPSSSKAGSIKVVSLSKSCKLHHTTSVGITIPPSYSNAEDNRVILFSIHNDEWKSFQCHHQTALRSKRWYGNLIHSNASIYEDNISIKLRFKDKDIPQILI
ncbi:hypothetical protein Tco_1093960 [Tanacetum coccineum]|uniref:Uncharacterized protein n=1 Tax=Tanacetum coccineum TaxID=301880 RepID=A0ABQ5IGB3_9ASTR